MAKKKGSYKRFENQGRMMRQRNTPEGEEFKEMVESNVESVFLTLVDDKNLARYVDIRNYKIEPYGMLSGGSPNYYIEISNIYVKEDDKIYDITVNLVITRVDISKHKRFNIRVEFVNDKKTKFGNFLNAGRNSLSIHDIRGMYTLILESLKTLKELYTE